MAGLSGKVAGIFTVADATGTVMTDEATTANGAKTRYTITNTARRYIPLGSTVVVKKNAVVQTTGFHVERAGGVVVFDAALTTETITVSGNYVTPTEVAGWYAWSAKNKFGTPFETTDFMDADAGWETYILLPSAGATATCQRWWADQSFMAAMDAPMLFKLFIDTGAGLRRYEGWGYITSDVAGFAYNKVIDEAMTATFTQGLYYREG